MEQPQQTQSSSSHSTDKSNKTIIGVVIVVLLLVLGYWLMKDNTPEEVFNEESSATETTPVLVDETPLKGGQKQPPAGFPSGVLVESDKIIESTTTSFVEIDAKQLFVGFISNRSLNDVYSNLLTYMIQQGYEISEGTNPNGMRTIFGSKNNSTFSVVVSSREEGVYAQVSYLVYETQ